MKDLEWKWKVLGNTYTLFYGIFPDSSLEFVVQSLKHVRLFATPWTVACQASLSFTIFWSLPRLMSTEWGMPSNHLVLCHFLLLPSIFPTTEVFSNESVLRIRRPKYWNFSFSNSPSNECSRLTGLISLLSEGLSRVFSSTTV